MHKLALYATTLTLLNERFKWRNIYILYYLESCRNENYTRFENE